MPFDFAQIGRTDVKQKLTTLLTTDIFLKVSLKTWRLCLQAKKAVVIEIPLPVQKIDNTKSLIWATCLKQHRHKCSCHVNEMYENSH